MLNIYLILHFAVFEQSLQPLSCRFKFKSR